MARKIRKNIALENRRNQLDAELQAIQRELRRKIRGDNPLPDPVAVLRRIWPGSDESTNPPPLSDRGAAQPGDSPAADRSTKTDAGGESRTVGPIQRGDARFASYFVTGGLHGIEPMRHEKRVLRARAIALIVLFLFILITVYWIFS
jgi:hypothetical protein